MTNSSLEKKVTKSRLGNSGFSLGKTASKAVAPEDPNATKVRDIPLEAIIVKQQVRRDFSGVPEFAEGVKDAGGIDTPITVEDNGDGTYTIVDGEMRFRTAKLNGYATIPAVIKKNLDPITFREKQVQANINRTDLSAYEIVMGVKDDVDNYGREGAKKIWKQGESWLSKRLGATKYLPNTMYLLTNGISGDFELLGALNQLEKMDEKEAKKYKQAIVDGKTVDRAELQNKVALKKRQAEEAAEYAAQQEKEIEERINTSQLSIIPDEESSAGHVQDKEAISKSLSVAADAILKNETVKSTTTSGASGEKVSAGKPGKSAVAAPKQKDEAKDIEGDIRQYRADFVEWGEGTRLELGNFFKSVKAGKMAPDQADLILWTLFLDHMLPMLDALGDQRSKIFIDKLTNLTRKQKMTPGEIFGLLHDGSAINEDIATIKMLGIQDLPESIKI